MRPGLAVAFAGTPEFALPALEAIHASRHHIVAVLAQPDRPAGRGRKVSAGAVRRRADELGLPVQQPESLRNPAAISALAACGPEVMVVVAYGLLLPPAVLALPPFGCVNIHASLLPRWRGAAPIQRAILAGDTSTGVCVMRLEAGLDTGPVMLREVVEIGTGETAGELHDRLAPLGAGLVVQALDQLQAGLARFEPQPSSGVTYARKLEKSEAQLDWTRPARELARQVRALNPWPVAETALDGRQLRIWRAHPAAAPSSAARGCVLQAGSDGIVVMTGEDALVIESLQLAGGRPMSAGEFIQSRALAGRMLG